MDENPALALKDHIEGIDDVLSYTELGTLTQVADDMLLSGLQHDPRIQIKGTLVFLIGITESEMNTYSGSCISSGWKGSLFLNT